MFDLHRFMRYVDFISIWQHRSKLSRRPLFAYFVDTSPTNTYLEGWIWKSIVFDYVNTHKFDFEFPVYS